LARTHLQDALSFAEEQRIPIQVIQTLEMERPEYVRNDATRCFHCKDELFTTMHQFAQDHGFQTIAYGVNLDDQGDFRPGQRAAAEHHVAAPLLQAELTKIEIRELARRAGLRVWKKPASACLSSRIEYGRPVTRESLMTVEQGEDAFAGAWLSTVSGAASRRNRQNRNCHGRAAAGAYYGDVRRVVPHL